MPLFDMLANSYALMSTLWHSPFMLLPLALVSIYAGWRVVEFIPFTRRIIDRREGGK